jgi:hypothetical protein
MRAVVLIFAHVAACSFVALGHLEPSGENNLTWLVRYQLAQASMATTYSIAVYFVFTTLCSVGTTADAR